MLIKKLSTMTAVASAIVLAACGAKDEKKPMGTNTGNVIKIASVSPLSGGTANAGKDNQSGALLAVEEVNAKGGVDIGGKKYMLELVSEDDAADPKQGTIAAQKVVDDKTITAVIGHYNSGVTMAAQPIYAKAGLVTITPSATNPDVTIKASKGEGGLTMMYRMVAHDAMQGPALATYAHKKGFKNIAIVDDATTYGKGMADQVEKKAKELGLSVVSHDAATAQTTDFKNILTKVKASNPDAVMWGGLDDTAATFAKQARELGIKSVLLMPDAVCTDNYISLAGTAAEGTICSVTGVPLQEMKEGAAFKERFEKRFAGQKVQGFAPFAYDAVLTLVEAIKKAGSTEPTKVAAAMKGIQATGLSGSIAFDDATGERKDTVITILEEKGKAFVPVDKIK
ncbi:branched-chain amino acid ABC transporter substrate-binding protein [Hydromonas duriensis]|uniref:Amino acid/amide ABC transporter substrate-binding protein (HAAT family) n=1 Tax=Hydromonas duriensis TaxID=1527608 RepID=A0A4R6YAK0_9BURK|nr:branched-chain amino acid ABC transporter substrate-binding protein [Hydromonas duriensis]TDR32597.1 amino acid/amide ABC transporter substrate-binding protein (HAAT family) [Hydromonas duriensis]